MGEFDYTQEERQRDVNAGLYQKFYIETPVEDANVTIGAETSEVINVAVQIADPAGDAIEEQFYVRCFVCSDAEGMTIVAMTGVTVAIGTDGLIIEEVTADAELRILTDTSGKFDLDFTDASAGSETGYLGIVLPNGKYVVSDAITFTA